MALLFFCLSGLAEPIGSNDSGSREVVLSFNVFSLGGAKGLTYFPQKNMPAKPLKFYSAYRSPVYGYKGPPLLRFYSSDSTNIDPPIAVCNIPEGASNLLLLFIPRESPSPEGIRYDVYGVDDGTTRTPPGSFSIINISGREYVAQYSGNRITIPEGIGPANPGKPRVVLQLAAQVNGSWMPTGKHYFNMRESDRVTLIFYPPASQTGVYPIIRRLVDGPSDSETE